VNDVYYDTVFPLQQLVTVAESVLLCDACITFAYEMCNANNTTSV